VDEDLMLVHAKSIYAMCEREDEVSTNEHFADNYWQLPVFLAAC